MATPTKEEIKELAQKMFQEQNQHLPCITAEDSELKENGQWFEARNELMRDNEKAECLSYLESEAHSLGYRLIPEKEFVSDEKQQNYVDLKTLANEILRFGDLLVIANKGMGKTNALMELAREFRKDFQNKVIIFETFPKWIHEFDAIPYLYIKDSDVTESDRLIQNLRESETKLAFSQNKDLLFCLAIEDTERLSFFISSIVYHFYRKHYLTAYKYGLEAIKERVIFVCEESQNLFDSTIISKKVFNKLRKMFSETRNLKIHFVMASQRLQDLNTKIRGRTKLLFGNVSLDDWELKISRILRHSQYRSEVLEFPMGRFAYAPTDSLIQFSKFEQNGKPYEIARMPLLTAKSLQPLKAKVRG